MSPVGPMKFKRTPEPVRRQVEIATATAWEDLVEVHARHALRFVELLRGRLAFDDAIRRYLDEMDLRDPMASSVRSRVLVALEDGRLADERAGRADLLAAEDDAAAGGQDGLRRFRPDVVMRGIARRARASEEVDQWVALATAGAEEAVIRVHIANAMAFAALHGDGALLADSVEEYIDAMRITGGRAQAVFQRTMAALAEQHLPEAGPAGG